MKLPKRKRYVFRSRPTQALAEVPSITMRFDWESNVYDLMEGFEKFLLASGFHQGSIDIYVLEWAEAIEERRTSVPK